MKNKSSAIRKPGVTKGFSTLTLNLRFGLADDGVNSWDYRKKALPALFKKYHSDFSLGKMINIRSKGLGLRMLLQNLCWVPTMVLKAAQMAVTLTGFYTAATLLL